MAEAASMVSKQQPSDRVSGHDQHLVGPSRARTKVPRPCSRETSCSCSKWARTWRMVRPAVRCWWGAGHALRAYAAQRRLAARELARRAMWTRRACSPDNPEHITAWRWQAQQGLHFPIGLQVPLTPVSKPQAWMAHRSLPAEPACLTGIRDPSRWRGAQPDQRVQQRHAEWSAQGLARWSASAGNARQTPSAMSVWVNAKATATAIGGWRLRPCPASAPCRPAVRPRGRVSRRK